MGDATNQPETGSKGLNGLAACDKPQTFPLFWPRAHHKIGDSLQINYQSSQQVGGVTVTFAVGEGEMSEMIERIAKALIDEDPCIEGYHESHMAIFRPKARVALQAMREPTEGMVQAGVGWDGIQSCYSRMIDEALKT